MHRTRTVFVSSLVALAMALTACGSDDSDSSSSSSSTRADSGARAEGRPILKAGDSATLGRIVVDDQGRTVYTFTDAGGAAVACEGSCLAAWPPVVIVAGTSATGGSGVRGVGSAEGPEGEQATVDGVPVYTFSGDAGPGDTNGEGIPGGTGTWHVVRLSGSGAAGAGGSTGTSSSTSTTSTTTSGDDDYGY